MKFFCGHKYFLYREIHGDEINWLDGKRSIGYCIKCGHLKLGDRLDSFQKEGDDGMVTLKKYIIDDSLFAVDYSIWDW